MSYPGSGVWALRTAAGAALFVLACGSARSTPYYEAPQSLHSASAAGSGALDGQGGSGGGGGTTLVSTGGSSEVGGAGGSVGGAGASSAGATTTGGTSGNAGTGTGGSVALGGSGGDTVSGGEPGSAGDTGGAGAPSADCSGHDASARDFDGHCYLYRPDAMTWRDANDDCESRGAHLVTISSEGRSVAEFLAENAFVWQLTGASPSWIDATDGKGPHQKGDGTYFKWNTGEAMTLDNWSSGQPNNSSTSCDGDPCSCDQGSCYEHCGFQWENPGREMDSVPGWNDRLGDHRISFVCEWET